MLLVTSETFKKISCVTVYRKSDIKYCIFASLNVTVLIIGSLNWNFFMLLNYESLKKNKITWEETAHVTYFEGLEIWNYLFCFRMWLSKIFGSVRILLSWIIVTVYTSLWSKTGFKDFSCKKNLNIILLKPLNYARVSKNICLRFSVAFYLSGYRWSVRGMAAEHVAARAPIFGLDWGWGRWAGPDQSQSRPASRSASRGHRCAAGWWDRCCWVGTRGPVHNVDVRY
jgi:hypothetical protein